MSTLRKKTENFNINTPYNGIILNNEPLKDKTTFKVGGNADFFSSPENSKDIISLIKNAALNKCPWFVIGGGSNLVVSDKGVAALVISTSAIDYCYPDKEKSVLICGAGCLFDKITDFCINNSLSGLERFAGLPGTAGGAAFMNARCYETSLSDILHSVKYIDISDLTEKNYVFNEKDWAYKKSPFQNTKNIITEVSFNIKPGNGKKIQEESQSFIDDREKKGHFRYPSAGSVFKNNHDFGSPSGKIIDEVGLRGTSVGGAQVAPWHGNFIINKGDATASDIKALVELIQNKVKKEKGFSLECEIIFTDNNWCTKD